MKRIFRSGLFIGAVAVGVVAGTSPAYAAGDWEATGFQPTCDIGVPGPTGWSYYDFTKPRISLAVVPRIVVGNTDKPVTLAKLRVTDSCSGVRSVQMFLSVNGVVGSSGPSFTAPTDKSHDFTQSFSGNANVSDTGRYGYPSIIATDRFESFQLDNAFKVLASPTSRSGTEVARYAAGTNAYATKYTYIMRQTVLTQTTSKTRIKKGSSFTVGGKLTFANGVGFSNLAGRNVALQYYYNGSWRTAQTKATSTSGTVGFTVKPTSTKKWRLAYTGQYSAPWYAPITTGGAVVTVVA